MSSALMQYIARPVAQAPQARRSGHDSGKLNKVRAVEIHRLQSVQ
jgi:hypothetical protein